MSLFRHVTRPCQPVQAMLREPVVHHLQPDVLCCAAIQPSEALYLAPRFRWDEEAERHEPLPRGWYLGLPFTPASRRSAWLDCCRPGLSGRRLRERTPVEAELTPSFECHSVYTLPCRFAVMSTFRRDAMCLYSAVISLAAALAGS